MLRRLPDGKIALAVSGGSDSLAMLVLALREVGPNRLTVLTVDHGLRDHSADEAAQVGAWCAVRAVRHYTLTLAGPKPKTGIQAWARTARYDAMTHWCLEHRVPTLLTAHTLNDQAETVAMRKQRTDSDESLAGIWPEMQWRGITILRPLLHVSRTELRELLRSEGVAWFDDPSNDNPRFERVRVRRSLEPQEISGLAKQADLSRAKVQACRNAARAFIKAHVKCDEYGLISWKRSVFSSCEGDVQALVLAWACRRAGDSVRIEKKALDHLVQDCATSVGFRRTLAGAMIAVRRAEILLGREPGRISERDVLVSTADRVLWDQRFWLTVPLGSRILASGPICPKPEKSLPAFVFSSLPKVILPDGQQILPHFATNPQITVTLSERFRL